MSHGSVLQNFNKELEKSLESIYERRENVHNEILKDDEKKKEIEAQIAKIKNELHTIDAHLESKYELKNEFEKVLFNSESAFKKILENSKTLMNIVKKEEYLILKKIEEKHQVI